jgi:hypothetical protein
MRKKKTGGKCCVKIAMKNGFIPSRDRPLIVMKNDKNVEKRYTKKGKQIEGRNFYADNR